MSNIHLTQHNNKKKTEKPLYLLAVILILLSFTKANAQLLVEEFDYTGELTSNGWSAHSGGGTNPIATSTGLTYTDYPNSGTGNAAYMPLTGEDANLGFSSVTSGTIYTSFLVNVTTNHTASSTGDYFFHLGTASGASAGNFHGRIAAVNDGTNHEFSLEKTTGSITTTNINVPDGTTCIIVLKYTFVAGANNDVVSLFVFPAGGSYPTTEPGTPALTSSSGADAADLESVCLRQATNTIDLTVDGIHVATTWAGVLPVEMTSFSARAEKAKIKLSFSTATETNNSHFAIERSADARAFSEIGQVQGAGTTREPQSYTFTDVRPLAGTNYYRLRQVDYDGTESFSPVVSVVFGKQDRITLAPSPATDLVRIHLEEAFRSDGLWQLYDNMGRQVLSGAWEAESTDYELDVNALPEGMYTFRLVVGASVQVKQFRKL